MLDENTVGFETFSREQSFNSSKYYTFASKFNLCNRNCMANLNRLKIVLVEKDKTGKWLSEQLGKSTCTVSKWCKNTVQPDLNTLDKIAKLLDVDVKDLLSSTEKTN